MIKKKKEQELAEGEGEDESDFYDPDCPDATTPPTVIYEFLTGEIKTIPGSGSTAHSDGTVTDTCTGTFAETDIIGDLCVVAENDDEKCYTEGKYNNLDYPIDYGEFKSSEETHSGYKISPAEINATSSVKSNHYIYYKFPSKTDYKVYT